MTEAALNGSAEAPPPGVEEMPTITRLAQELSVSRRTIERAWQRGDLQRWQAKDGTYRYDRAQAATLLATVEDEKREADATKHVLNSSSDLHVQSLRLLQQAHQQIDRMQVPAQLALELLASENRRLSTENAALHQAHLSLVAAREQALSEEHDRALAAEAMRSREARKNHVFASLAKLAPTLLAQLQRSHLAGNAAAAAIASFRIEQLEALLATDFVSEEQKVHLRVVLEHMREAEDAGSSEPEAPGSSEPEAEQTHG